MTPVDAPVDAASTPTVHTLQIADGRRRSNYG